MGKILECGALCSLPKSREALAIVSDDYFDVKALDPKSHVTTTSVAAHFLYEKSRPDILKGPGGALNLSNTTYEQIDYNHVRVRGAKWEPEAEGEYTLKIEGARTTGFFTTFLGAFRDPILISQLDAFLAKAQKMVKERMGDVKYDLKIHRYGIDGVMGSLETDYRVPKEVCVVVQARAASQKTANEIASGCKFAFTHLPYEGQVATAGNFAWPFTPCEMPAGPLSEFCIYHIMHNCHPTELTPVNVFKIEGNSTNVALR
jgi:Acyclic terpene utilisation family protein AtuA